MSTNQTQTQFNDQDLSEVVWLFELTNEADECNDAKPVIILEVNDNEDWLLELFGE